MPRLLALIPFAGVVGEAARDIEESEPPRRGRDLVGVGAILWVIVFH